ncbi:hypothetical protein HNR25_001180 [Streptomonospora salina]|uniref:Uncharacterized protein n=1 Tax=Streptomonospora salina TaxID=104205 RepID=A0A841E7Z4_9ACTN|nr:hypothetical protein [Streptomonospora salina]
MRRVSRCPFSDNRPRLAVAEPLPRRSRGAAGPPATSYGYAEFPVSVRSPLPLGGRRIRDAAPARTYVPRWGRRARSGRRHALFGRGGVGGEPTEQKELPLGAHPIARDCGRPCHTGSGTGDGEDVRWTVTEGDRLHVLERRTRNADGCMIPYYGDDEIIVPCGISAEISRSQLSDLRMDRVLDCELQATRNPGGLDRREPQRQQRIRRLPGFSETGILRRAEHRVAGRWPARAARVRTPSSSPRRRRPRARRPLSPAENRRRSCSRPIRSSASTGRIPHRAATSSCPDEARGRDGGVLTPPAGCAGCGRPPLRGRRGSRGCWC